MVCGKSLLISPKISNDGEFLMEHEECRNGIGRNGCVCECNQVTRE